MSGATPRGARPYVASLLERGLRTPTLTVFFTIAEGLDIPPSATAHGHAGELRQGRHRCNCDQEAEMAKTPLRDGVFV